MRFIPFDSTDNDIVYINPESVIRVESGRNHYNPSMYPKHQTFIVQAFGGGVFVDEPINKVLSALEAG